MPEQLKEDYSLLQTFLQGSLPIHIKLPDQRCWGKSGVYTMKDGYNSVHNSSRKEGIWKNVWCSDGLPKIYFFCWLFTHQKILTADNLKKRGIKGLSRCILCKRAEETQNHLFLECSFSNEVWCSVLNELNFNITLPTNLKDLFACWKDYYQGTLFKKPDFSKAWMALPKYVY